jgi:hypothetical protein
MVVTIASRHILFFGKWMVLQTTKWLNYVKDGGFDTKLDALVKFSINGWEQRKSNSWI